MLFPLVVNQRFPSEPAVMSSGRLNGVGIENSVITPAGVIRPMLFPLVVNQRLPSGPAVIPAGRLAGVGMSKKPLNSPRGVPRAIELASLSVTHRLPSGPAV